jgi:putative tryptophan/tyrosine transport system substrate-binding protein
MRRRDFVAGLSGLATLLPLPARAQQTLPVIGYFNSGTLATQADNLAAFRKGLNEAGFNEGRNVAIEFNWADNQYDRLPAMTNEVIARRPAVIVSNTLAALRVKAATATIPIVFTTGSDPVRDGLVASLSRPGGNVTGVVFITGDLGGKRLGLLRQLVPQAKTIAVLIYPNTLETEAERKDLLAAAHTTGQQLLVFDVKTASDIESAIATAAARGAGALLGGTGPFFFNHRALVVELAARHAIPAMYTNREYSGHGGMASYGADLPGAFRQAGIYAGRILKGEKPADLPVVQSTKIDFIINLKTAKALGLEFHPQLLATADEVIE